MVTGTWVAGGYIEVAASEAGIVEDYTAPVEDIFVNGVAHAVTGKRRREANKIV